MDYKINKILNNIKNLKFFENFIKENHNNLVFLCVGNSNVWYDSFGPIIGSLLKEKFNIPCFVYGNITNNINSKNLNSYIKWINKIHFDKKIVLFDSALTNENDIYVKIKKGSTKCAFYKKDSLSIGDISVLCPIKENENLKNFNFKELLNNVLLISNIISNSILKCNK